MSETPRPRRSALFMPASNARALEKAKGLAADVMIMERNTSWRAAARPRIYQSGA